MKASNTIFTKGTNFVNPVRQLKTKGTHKYPLEFKKDIFSWYITNLNTCLNFYMFLQLQNILFVLHVLLLNAH